MYSIVRDPLLTYDLGGADRTLTFSGNPTLADWFDQSVKTTAGPTFASLIVGSDIGIAADTDILQLAADTLTVNGSLNMLADTDASAQLGRVHVGYVGWGDWAGFSHVDVDATGTYALMQSSDGRTCLNAATGQYITFRINNDNKIRIDANGKLGINDTAPAEYLDVNGNINATGVLKIDDTQVVKEQQAHIADAPGDTAANNATTINAILAMLEAHGIVADA